MELSEHWTELKMLCWQWYTCNKCLVVTVTTFKMMGVVMRYYLCPLACKFWWEHCSRGRPWNLFIRRYTSSWFILDVSFWKTERSSSFSELVCATSDPHTSNDVPMAALCKTLGSLKLICIQLLILRICMDKIINAILHCMCLLDLCINDWLIKFTESFRIDLLIFLTEVLSISVESLLLI